MYLWGLSDVIEEMSIPVCTSMTFRQPSSPVLRTWRLSTTRGETQIQATASEHDLDYSGLSFFFSESSGLRFTFIFLELLVLLTNDYPWNASVSKTLGWWPFGVSSFTSYKLISLVSWGIKNNTQYSFSTTCRMHKYTLFCHEAALTIGKTSFPSSVFLFCSLITYFKIIIPFSLLSSVLKRIILPGLKAVSHTVPEWHGIWCNMVAAVRSQMFTVPSLVPETNSVLAAFKLIVST